MATIDIGGLTFHGQRHPSGLYFRRLVDWYSLPESKSEAEDRPRSHGSFSPGFDYRRAAVPSFEGLYVGSSRADSLAMQQKLTGALAGRDLRMRVADEIGATFRDVSVRSVQVQDIRNQQTFQFSIDTLAPDPLRYGDPTSTSVGLPVAGGGITWPLTWPITWADGGSDGRVIAHNDGTADTFPLLTVSGGVDGFSLTEVGTGREIRFERMIPIGSAVTVNPRTGRAWIDDPSNDVSGFLTRSDWWSVVAGSSSTIQFLALGAVSGTPTLTAVTSPAYW